MSIHQFPQKKSNPKPPKEPMFNVEDPAPYMVGIVLVLCHLGYLLAPNGFKGFANAAGQLLAYNGDVFLADRPLGVFSTLLTHTLLHANWSHVLMNAGMIVIFGVLTIRGVKMKAYPVFGTIKRGPAVFLAIFLLGAIGGGLAQWAYWMVLDLSGGAIGASTAGSALFAAAAWGIGGKKRLLSFGLVVLALDILTITMGGNPAWAGHLGGYLTGAALAVQWLKPDSAYIGNLR